MPEIPLERVDDNTLAIPETWNPEMKVPGIIYANREIEKSLVGDRSLDQVVNVAMLPGIVKASMGMPDIHWGYGFPIGGVAGFDLKEGIISPGGVGYDINCGVTLIGTDLNIEEIRPHIKELLERIFLKIPSGMSRKASFKINDHQMDEILSTGLQWAVSEGYATKDDILHTEDGGRMQKSDPVNVSPEARKRGLNQLGTLGSGNHFLEIQAVEQIMDMERGSSFNLHEGKATIMIHTGSRGLGHQVATDFVREIQTGGEGVVADVNDRQLSSVYFQSDMGQRYYEAMNAAANFAFVNRQIIVSEIRSVFGEVLHIDPQEMGMRIVYSLAHNMARVERHNVGKKSMDLVVHRKGATRAFPGSKMENGSIFRRYGHPVIIPGDMGTASYVLAGTQENLEKSFGSTCHGAGRLLSRKKSFESFSSSEVIEKMNRSGIFIKAASPGVVSEEAPGSYKNIDEVVATVAGSGLSIPVARLIPVGVVKG
ncbi:RtcB family protein [Oxyplasma meridianum]|uniref:tRNA-splicing ligase RtcB n=1 Tax=Oxyplasma meridianum TaxID=3073602 RepID=A0AAX4NIC6_9ARCH